MPPPTCCLRCRVAHHPFHRNKMCTDLVDALRRVEELPSGAVLPASRVPMHAKGVRVESATHRADVTQVPQEGNTLSARVMSWCGSIELPTASADLWLSGRIQPIQSPLSPRIGFHSGEACRGVTQVTVILVTCQNCLSLIPPADTTCRSSSNDVCAARLQGQLP